MLLGDLAADQLTLVFDIKTGFFENDDLQIL